MWWWGDVGGDGDVDIVIWQTGAASIRVYTNSGTAFSLYRSFNPFSDAPDTRGVRRLPSPT